MKIYFIYLILVGFIFGESEIDLGTIIVKGDKETWIDVSCKNHLFTNKVNCSKVLSEHSHEVTFEHMKCSYERDKEIGVRDISGGHFHFNKIFELPKEKQCHYYEVFKNNSWEDAGKSMEDEVNMLTEGINRTKGKKADVKYDSYIRTSEEIIEYLNERRNKKIKTEEERCLQGIASACVPAVIDSDSTKNSYKCLLTGCRLKDAMSCHYLADSYAVGWDVKKNQKKAVKIWKKACNLGDGSSCAHLGMLSFKANNMRDAARYLKDACRKNDKFACIWLQEYPHLK